MIKRLINHEEIQHRLFYSYIRSIGHWTQGYYDETNHWLFDLMAPYLWEDDCNFWGDNTPMTEEALSMWQRIEQQDPTVHLLPQMPNDDRSQFVLEFIQAQQDQAIKKILLDKFYNESSHQDIHLEKYPHSIYNCLDWLDYNHPQFQVLADEFDQKLTKYCLIQIQPVINQYQLNTQNIYYVEL